MKGQGSLLFRHLAWKPRRSSNKRRSVLGWSVGWSVAKRSFLSMCSRVYSHRLSLSVHPVVGEREGDGGARLTVFPALSNPRKRILAFLFTRPVHRIRSTWASVLPSVSLGIPPPRRASDQIAPNEAKTSKNQFQMLPNADMTVRGVLWAVLKKRRYREMETVQGQEIDYKNS